MSRPKFPPFTIITDTREQLPFGFDEFEPFIAGIRREGLSIGDYAAELADGTRPLVVVERKSQADLFASVTAGRDRFEREFQRALAASVVVHLVCECSWNDLDRPPATGFGSKVKPAVVKSTLISWSMRLGVRVWMAGGRTNAERITFHALRFAVEQHAAGQFLSRPAIVDSE